MLRFCSRLAIPATLSGNRSLKEHDPEMYSLLQKELKRQVQGIELIASENFTSRAVLECLGSVGTNKYAEGLPGSRYYGGTEVVDQIENVCRDRALQAFRLNPEEWGVNVQPYSGSPANFAVYTALLKPHDRIMGLDLPSGGHLTHGFYTQKARVSASSIFFESLPYRIGDDGLINYDKLEETAEVFKPRLIVAGGSAYPRDWDYARYRKVCDSVGAYLMMDMAHISGLIAAGEHHNPFEFADIVTTTTHKTLRGPRAGMIFFKKQYENQINNSVFPALQGGPHIHQIAAIATQLKEVMSPEYKAYAKQVKANAKALAAELMRLGISLVSSGTDNHLMLANLRPQAITGSKMEKLFDVVHLAVNKNSIAGDKSAVMPGGLRIGTPAMTTRGVTEEGFRTIANFIARGVDIGVDIQKQHDKLADFKQACGKDARLEELGKDIKQFATSYPFPGTENAFPKF